MNASRTLLRPQTALRVRRARIPTRRFYASESTVGKPAASGAGAGAITGGLIGAGATLGIAYGYYHFSGAKGAVDSARQAKSYVDATFSSLKNQLPDVGAGKNGDLNAQDALKALRDTATRYAWFIPGGRGYVDAAFDDLDAVRKQHGDEVDNIVREAYGELRDVAKKGLSVETAGETVNVLIKHLSRLSGLAQDAAGDILERHPQLKEKVGGSVDQLKELGEKYGPEAKKQVDEIREQISDLTKNGLQKDTVQKIQKLIQEKTEQIQQMGQQAYKKGMDEVRPLLEKNPKVKKLVEENMDQLKNGNVSQLVKIVRDAISSGKTDELEKYITEAKDQGSNQLSSWLGLIPSGGEVLSQFQSLQGLAKNKGKEAESLLKETVEEIKQVLEKKLEKAKQIRDSAKDGE